MIYEVSAIYTKIFSIFYRYFTAKEVKIERNIARLVALIVIMPIIARIPARQHLTILIYTQHI